MTKFYFTTETIWAGTDYQTTTKVFDPLRTEADWSGCHWDNPAIIACEQVEGCGMSDEMFATIHMIGAEEFEDEEE